jgi:hypothetical protein
VEQSAVAQAEEPPVDEEQARAEVAEREPAGDRPALSAELVTYSPVDEGVDSIAAVSGGAAGKSVAQAPAEGRVQGRASEAEAQVVNTTEEAATLASESTFPEDAELEKAAEQGEGQMPPVNAAEFITGEEAMKRPSAPADAQPVDGEVKHADLHGGVAVDTEKDGMDQAHPAVEPPELDAATVAVGFVELTDVPPAELDPGTTAGDARSEELPQTETVPEETDGSAIVGNVAAPASPEPADAPQQPKEDPVVPDIIQGS